MDAAVQDLMSLLNEEITDLKETLGEETRETDENEVQRLMESDDRVLGRLERLAGGLVVPDVGGGENQEAVKKAERLVGKLAVLREREIRARLNVVFLEEMRKGGDLHGVQEVQAELDDLYTQIPTVARGAAYNEFFQPLLELLDTARQSRGENWAVGGEYVFFFPPPHVCTSC